MPVRKTTYVGKQYDSNEDGKAAFVTEKLKPVLCSIDSGWVDAQYVVEGYNEYVILTNKNSDKTRRINVTADSIRALFADVVSKVIENY